MNFWSPSSSAVSDDHLENTYLSEATLTEFNAQPLELRSASVIHHGWLFKRGQGGFFHRSTWKARYCVVTSTQIRYYTFENGTKKGELDLRECNHKSIEVLPRKSYRSSHTTLWRFAINTPKRRMVFSASSEPEMNLWIRTIHMAMALHRNNLKLVQQVQLAERRTTPGWFNQREYFPRPTSVRPYGSAIVRRSPPSTIVECEF
ncbi:hypothetical protein THRCLA_08190 [Thraustotheca clavata]|uniref:PH domain-containing protein n=1 Tax=Thraustotheca clavata TaxID=74557 RepID=A0A1V9Z8S8_9STRA|nr:hypothetical protein THRCLA_08190 [Thraustotheca clavata]